MVLNGGWGLFCINAMTLFQILHLLSKQIALVWFSKSWLYYYLKYVVIL